MNMRTFCRLTALLIAFTPLLAPSHGVAQAPAIPAAPTAATAAPVSVAPVAAPVRLNLLIHPDSVYHIGGTSPTSALARTVVAGNTVYLSGALGTRAGPGVVEQATMVMESIRNSLFEVGGTMDDVVKCLVFMADLSERPAFNQVYTSFFPTTKPARSAIGVDLGGAKVEVECIAVLPKR